MLALAIIATILAALGFIAKSIYIVIESKNLIGGLLSIFIHFLTHGFTIVVVWVLYANTGT